jgi:hypothetical protein
MRCRTRDGSTLSRSGLELGACSSHSPTSSRRSAARRSRNARTASRSASCWASPEAAPLEAFGTQAVAAVSDLRYAREVEFIGGVRPLAADAGELGLDDGQRMPGPAIVSLPSLVGRRIPGLPRDAVGFVAVDEHQRVLRGGSPSTRPATRRPSRSSRVGWPPSRPMRRPKRSSASLGVPIVARPFDPVLEGVLCTDAEPVWLREPTHGTAPPPHAYSRWWPPSKIPGRPSGAFLEMHAGAPVAPELRREYDGQAVRVDVSQRARESGFPTDGEPTVRS